MQNHTHSRPTDFYYCYYYRPEPAWYVSQ